MKTHIKKLSISSLFPLLCFTVLAACIVIVLITGARLYSRSNTRDTEDYYHRTVTSYITTRVNQSRVAGDLFVGDFDDPTPKESGDTLYFIERFGEATYVTRLYCYDGALYELFSPMSIELDPESGESVLPLSDLKFILKDGLLTANVGFDDGKSVTLRLSLRTENSDNAK